MKNKKKKQKENRISYYTDGSLLTTSCGKKFSAFAFTEVSNDRIVQSFLSPIHRHSTNNVMELKAVIFACKNAMEKYGDNKTNEIYIFTDSAYVSNCCNKGYYKKWLANGWKSADNKDIVNKEYWLQLIPFFENEMFHICKTKAHSKSNIMNTYVHNIVQTATIEAAYMDCNKMT